MILAARLCLDDEPPTLPVMNDPHLGPRGVGPLRPHRVSQRKSVHATTAHNGWRRNEDVLECDGGQNTQDDQR